jgi:hypothetical protein
MPGIGLRGGARSGGEEAGGRMHKVVTGRINLKGEDGWVNWLVWGVGDDFDR